MSEAIYSQPTRNEIVQELEEASILHFGCDLVAFIQKLEAGTFSKDEDENVVIGDMKAWLRFLPADDKVFHKAHPKLNAA